ncbi:phospholipase-like, aminotransferase-like mobile domain protein [Tanacetum coccineum]
MSDSQSNAMEYPTTIHVKSKLCLFQLFKDKLNEDRCTLFKTTCFGPWLDIIYVENDDGMIHYVLQKQCCSDDDNFDLPLIYHVNGHSLHFGHREFCLLTGFEFGSISFREYRNGDIPFRNRLFPEKIGYDVKIIDLFALFDDEEKFSKLSDKDAIRLCLLLSLEGEHIWRQLYDSIRNVSSIHKLEHLVGLKRNPNHVPSYSLTGFLFSFKIWILESSCVSDRWWTKVPEIIPRALSWRRKVEFNQYEYFGELFRKALIELAPTKDEVHCNWYAPSNDYFMCYVPRSPLVSIGGLYREYLNKISTARAPKKKSSKDFHPSECVREASLIDRVRELECICETLLTLPKEVKSLRGRIHKLESIIQSSFYPSRVVKKEARLNKIAEEDKQRKCLGHMNSSAHMKLAIERCVLKKRKCVDVLRSLFYALPKILNVPSIEQLANQKNVLNPLMIEKCKSVKPWIEDLSRPFKRIDKNFLSHELQVFLSRVVVGRFKFSWSNDITVDRSFWNGLCALDDNRKGWLLDESLAMFHICSGVVTFYDSERTEGGECRKWYLQMRDYLEEKIHVVLKETGVFEKKNIDPAKYKISFKVADGVPKQSGVFGDCGVFLCMLLYRLANGIPLALDDPL